MVKNQIKARIALEDGTVFEGFSFTGSKESEGEVVFNTSLTGYQEVVTDPSYFGQIVVMTYPLIGNYGINLDDSESLSPKIAGFVVKEYSRISSNWRSNKDLGSYLKENKVLGIEGVDTRALVGRIRIKGAMKAIISTSKKTNKELIEKAKKSKGIIGQDLVKNVTAKKSYFWNNSGKYKVVVLDCGVKFNILRMLQQNKCKVFVMPAHSNSKEILKQKPDGVMISNGPGDPAAVSYLIEEVKNLLGKVPLFGICLGNQILGLAQGAKTYKLKFGHHGGNHPVKDLRTGRISITVQNHGFCLDPNTLDKKNLEITHINLNDHTVEGLRHKKMPISSVQFHPESCPGSHDAQYLFSDFIKMIKKFKMVEGKRRM
ncbi:MAG: glutamine-hydrolyzing carbamoyl-phosphate synthase small subunit [Candidatus Omnitrophica bacterium]|nr:glutamine-hydrolyzing carbamoyl-phosphate synthase small subunit [Candidatus Omnitrophota bacterium]